MTQYEQAIEEHTGNTVDLLVSIESLLSSIDTKLDVLIKNVRQLR